MTKHKVFNFRLFRDMLRQLLLPGAVMAGICLVFALLLPLIVLIRDSAGSGWGYEYEIVAPVLWLYLFVGGAGLVYAVFSHLNRRNSADYYYNLPNTAAATFLSLFAAAAMWMIATVTVSLAAAYFGYMTAGLVIPVADMGNVFAYYLIGTLQTAAAAALACSITGTRLANIVVTAVILWVPRLITMLIGVTAVRLAWIVPYGPYGGLSMWLDPHYNIAAAPVTLLTKGFGVTVDTAFAPSYMIPPRFPSARVTPVIDMAFVPSYLYSGILALLLLAAALILYCRRPAEWAEKSMPTPVRYLCGCALMIAPMTLIGIQAAADGKTLFEFVSSRWNLGLVAGCIIAAAVLFFCFEAVTTKRLKALLRALPLFVGLVVAVPVCFYELSCFTAEGMLRQRADPAEIRSVTFDWRYQIYPEYNRVLCDRTEVCIPEINGIVSASLDRARERPKLQFVPMDAVTVATVIRTDEGTLIRDIPYSHEEWDAIRAAAARDPAFAESLAAMPPSDSVGSVSLAGVEIIALDRSVYDVYYDEMTALSVGERYHIVQELRDLKLGRWGIGIWAEAFHGSGTAGYLYPLTFQTPRTVNTMCRSVNRSRRSAAAELRGMLENGTADQIFLEMEVYDMTGEGEGTDRGSLNWKASSGAPRPELFRTVLDWYDEVPEEAEFNVSELVQLVLKCYLTGTDDPSASIRAEFFIPASEAQFAVLTRDADMTGHE